MYKTCTLLVEKSGSGADVLDLKPKFFYEIQEILGTAQNVHPQYVGDSTMDTQNPKRMDIESNCKKLTKLENQKLSHPHLITVTASLLIEPISLMMSVTRRITMKIMWIQDPKSEKETLKRQMSTK
ncbi:hypothetical protein DAPPUDRAFT_331020 [Daphnia pulex]|uniref:Uncharacterized protein n=1 Tax=Daphnia pulex TaxID=6669 RepID=E9HL97_DAPPU|nr:hypothetical protein DAPPUDRAFT_333365 [Daphnia pulex]EFX67461.1 hypothetical protein DAPPUDRAFT_331020 [Daphnia pulex]|eukprot:EFX65259.1 hypothetical protein DAPPUDRAFT_333365 [Daphnia pulex]